MVTLLLPPVITAATTQPEPSTEPESLWRQWAQSLLSGAPDWVQTLTASAFGVGAILVGAAVVWVLGRIAIRTLTRSIETGLPFRRKARRALERSRLAVASVDPQELRLEQQRRRQRARTIRTVLNSALAAVIVAILVVMALDMVGLPVAPLIASAGIVGVALGFGAQSLVKDLLSGLFMLIEDQYGVGDVVDLGQASGTVEEVGLRSTRLRSLDGTVWYIPNGEVVRVGNMTRLWSRALIEVRLDYHTDLDAAREAMLASVVAAREANPEVESAILGEPEVPGIESFDYRSVTIRLLIQVAPVRQWLVMREVRLQMRRIFAERGIRFALPDQALMADTTPVVITPTSDEEDSE